MVIYSLCSLQAVNSGRQLRAALLDHVGQVLLPDDAVLLLVLDDRALQAGGQVVRTVTSPEPKLPARAMLLASTEIASAVESTPLGVLSLFLPSSVCSGRSSRKMVTTFSIASAAGTFAFSCRWWPDR